jgi:hypothetical protein
MTKLLDKAVAALRSLPAETQDDIARAVLLLTGHDDQTPYKLTSEEDTIIAASLAEAARGEFATDDEIRAIWAKHGL